MDVLNGAIVFVGDGKGVDALAPFLKRLRRFRKAKVEAVAIDMSPAYIRSVRDNLKDAVVVFDHFHVIKLFKEKLSNFRRQLHNNSIHRGEKRLLKGTRWLLLIGQENLVDEKQNADIGTSLRNQQTVGDRLLHERRSEATLELVR